MEKQQADSLQKSPVPKPVTSTDTEINGQSTQVLTNGSHLDKSPKSTEKLPSATYQDGISCKETLVDKKPIESADLDEKTKAEVKKSIDREEVPHAIISVDIQKSMPYEKHAVPQEVGKDSKGDVPPEVLASVVTTAVVNEAALTVSGTDASAINGTKIVSDSSKVDAVVEQELSKMSDLKTDNIELQNGGESSKPILNGDIDHSPLSEDTTAEMGSHLTETSTSSKEEIKTPKEVSDKKDTTHSVKLESELPKQSISETSSKLEDTSVEKRQSIDGGQVNGVPGIITVESITKREPTQTSREEEVGSVTDTDKQKDNIETMTSNSVTLSEGLENVKGVPGSVKETEANKSEPESIEKLSKQGEAKSDRETKAELPGIEHKVADDNLTDSAKLLRENLTDGAKLKTEITEKSKDEPLVKSESETITEVHKTKIVDAVVDKSKEETSQKSKEEKVEQETKKEEDSSKSEDQIKNDDTLYAGKVDESKIEEKVEGAKEAKESKGLEQKSELISDKDSKEGSSATEIETSTFLEKKEVEQKDITANGASPKKSPLSDESIKTKEMCDIQTTKSPSLSPKKTKTEEEISSLITSVPISEESSKSKADASEPQTEKSIAEEMAESNKTSETVCDMSLMMTSQILTPELLNAEEDTETIEKTKEVSETLISEETRKDDTREKSLEKSDVTELLREESCRVSAARYSPETCDVAVGLDEHRMVRVAAGDGGEEEVDGQQASAEVEVTDEALQSHTEEDAGSENIIGNGAASPSSGTPSSDRVASSAKISATPSSKPSSGISQKDDESQKGEDSKPASAVSRSSIPEPITYEPPERRKSAASATSEDKKDLDADKSQKDEQESEKSAEKKAEEERTEETSAEESDKKEEVKSIDNKSEATQEVADSKAEEKVSIKDEKSDITGDKEKDLDINKEVEKEDESKKAVEIEKVTEEKTEKGVEDEKEKETIESKREVPEAENESGGEMAKGVDDIKAPADKTAEASNETAESQPAEISGSQSPTPSVKEDDKSDVASEKRDEALNKPSEESGKEKSDEETKSEEVIAENEKEISAEKSEEEGKLESLEKQDKPENSEKEDKADSLDREATPEVSQMEDKAEISEKEEKAETSKVEDETEITKKEAAEKEEDKTKIEKDDKAEVAEKESESQISEKEDKAEVPEIEDKAEISEKEKEAEISTEEKETSEKEDRATTPEKDSAEHETKTMVTEAAEKPEEEEEKPSASITEEAKSSEDGPEKEEPTEEEKPAEDAEKARKSEESEGEAEKGESEAEDEKKDEEKKEPEQEDEQEKQDEDKEHEEKPESPPKSPTKRMRSPDKAGRRGSLPQLRLVPKGSGGWGVKGLPPVGRISPMEGVSPISSPPKPLKTPPSPQKPQKSTSPKKKNGMLSPVKVPKTPGSDTRKLPPIKAPVGLAPNPNLKNIRSKIGSFDNIRYKPGGGDKKVISKKLEWKATPKIGSLDHSFKSGERKHGKSHSKGDLKDGKLTDGQSPLPSGDEAEAEGATAVAETLIKPDGSGSTEMPAAITAES